MNLNILYEDDQIIVCEKPQGVPVQSDKTTDPDMVNQLKNYIFEKEEKGVPYIGLVHRLDRPVGGVMVFAKTPQAVKDLSKQVQDRSMNKYYHALVYNDLSGEINGEPKILTDHLVRDGRSNLSKVTGENEKSAKKAQLKYQVLEVLKETGYSLIEIELLTGRHHQIRVQAAKHLGGIIGDTKYNKTSQEITGYRKICLYAVRLEFYHPKTKKRMCFLAETPNWWDRN